MHKKLTITLDEKIYHGLYSTVGAGKISQFIANLLEPHVLHDNLTTAYEQMAADEMREQDALAWSEGLIGDISDVAR